VLASRLPKAILSCTQSFSGPCVPLFLTLGSLTACAPHWKATYVRQKDNRPIHEQIPPDTAWIGLSHLGYQYASDQVSNHMPAPQVEGLDLILGGHPYPFPDQPTLLKSPLGQEVVVNQAGWAGLRIGRIDSIFLPRQRGIQVSGPSLLIGDEKNFSVSSTGS